MGTGLSSCEGSSVRGRALLLTPELYPALLSPVGFLPAVTVLGTGTGQSQLVSVPWSPPPQELEPGSGSQHIPVPLQSLCTGPVLPAAPTHWAKLHCGLRLPPPERGRKEASYTSQLQQLLYLLGECGIQKMAARIPAVPTGEDMVLLPQHRSASP